MPTPGDTICGEIVLEQLAPSSLGAEVFQPLFLARNTARDEPLWLTVIDGTFTPTSVDLSSFMAGANALMSVRHPSLVRVVLVDREEDYCVVGYEQLPGAEALAELVIQGDGRRLLARVAVEVARGLAYLHRRGLLHGALTPGTVVVWEGVPVLWEHGLAGLCDPSLFGPRARSLGGDVVAPEVPSGAPLTPAADVYAWGAVMAAVASGELGAAAVSAVLEGDVDPGRHGLLLGVVRQALAPEPGRRPRDGMHLLDLLQRALSSVDPNTELEAPAAREAGGDDALRELASRYLAEMSSLEKARGSSGPQPVAVVQPPPAGALGRLGLVKRSAREVSGGIPAAPLPPPPESDWNHHQPLGPHPAVREETSGLGAADGPEPGAVGSARPSAFESVRWVSRSPETSASGWLRPAHPRAEDGGVGGLFEAHLGYAELDDGVRKRSVLAPGTIARLPTGDHPPPRRGGTALTFSARGDGDDTPPEGIPIDDRDGSRSPPAPRGPVDFEVLLGEIPQSERETPMDVEIVVPLSRAREPSREPDLPDLHDENELPPMPDQGAGAEATATRSAPGRSQVREGFRVPRTPGPHGPRAGIMAGVLAALCGVAAVASTLGASSARGGLLRMWGGLDPAGAVEAGGAGEPGAEGPAGVAAPEPCPAGMVEIRDEAQAFCIDRAEYPGLDEVPATEVDLPHAQQACVARGHGLCTEVQWARACAGEADWRYPYGAKREAGRCRVGDAKAAPGPSGADPHCVTPEGVLDLVGNVAEWTEEGAVMGGSVRSPKATGCSSSQKMKPKTSNDTVGFRCCLALHREGGGSGPGTGSGG